MWLFGFCELKEKNYREKKHKGFGYSFGIDFKCCNFSGSCHFHSKFHGDTLLLTNFLVYAYCFGLVFC